MSSGNMIELSSQILLSSFIILLLALIPLGASVKSKKELMSRLGIGLTCLSFLLQLLYFSLRWIAIGHAPVSNLYEFMTFFGIMFVGSALLIFRLYKQLVVLLFSIPISLIIIGYGAVFTSDAAPLIPALQSNWLSVHVITVALASAVLSLAFATGVIYLLRVTDVQKKTGSTRSLEFVMYCLIVAIGFIISSFAFPFITDKMVIHFESKNQITEEAVYKMPAIFVNDGAVLSDQQTGVGFIELSNSINANKLNTVVWSFIVGTALYMLILIITRKNISQLIKPFTRKVDPLLMDEISYRAVVIGFPLFSLGGLLFAMIWAQLAWSRFWGWDPKEVWALITWLFYASLLHLRTSKGWDGKRTAWMSIIGFGLIVFNQVFVNLVIAGLHSYA